MKKHTLELKEPYTQIINDLLDAILIGDFAKRELKIIFAIIRKTYGFHKLEDEISLTQLSKITGLQPQHISQTIKKLIARRVITKREGKRADTLSINKNCSEWIGTSKTGIPKTGIPKIDDSYSQNGSNGMPETGNTKESFKENKKKSPKLKFQDDHLVCAKTMFQMIKEINPKHKEPNFDKWANTIRLMVELDERSTDEIINLYGKVMADIFWRSNVLCPEKLREKWDRLCITFKDSNNNEDVSEWQMIINRFNHINEQRKRNHIEPIEEFKGAPYETPSQFRRRVAQADGCNDYTFCGNFLEKMI